MRIHWLTDKQFQKLVDLTGRHRTEGLVTGSFNSPNGNMELLTINITNYNGGAFARKKDILLTVDEVLELVLKEDQTSKSKR
jgi:hypothetical protein